MPSPLSTALYTRRKKNRFRNMPNVQDARSTTTTNVQITFNQDISAIDYLAGWDFVIDGKLSTPSVATPSGNDIVNFTLLNPLAKNEQISFRYKRESGNYKGQRGEIMQSSTGYVFNMV